MSYQQGMIINSLITAHFIDKNFWFSKLTYFSIINCISFEGVISTSFLLIINNLFV